MITFTKRMIDLVLSGQKTQTRRLWPHGARARVGSIHTIRCGRFSPACGSIRILDVRRQRLGEITNEEAIAEGFSGREGFLAYFESINGLTPLWTPVWVVEFELVKEER